MVVHSVPAFFANVGFGFSIVRERARPLLRNFFIFATRAAALRLRMRPMLQSSQKTFMKTVALASKIAYAFFAKNVEQNLLKMSKILVVIGYFT